MLASGPEKIQDWTKVPVQLDAHTVSLDSAFTNLRTNAAARHQDQHTQHTHVAHTRMDDLAAAAAAAAPVVVAAGPRGQRTTALQRWSVVSMHNDERSNVYIARKLNISRTTVRNILARYDATGSPGSGSRSGRPRCTDDATDTALAFTARVDVFTSPRQIRRKLELGDAVSARTIDRRLQEAGLFGRIARHKRDYTAEEL